MFTAQKQELGAARFLWEKSGDEGQQKVPLGGGKLNRDLKREVASGEELRKK